MITHARLLELVKYDPITGKFSARLARQGLRDPDDLGNLEASGYRRICLDGRRYLAGRLAWFYVHGRWPASQIDHRDLNRDHNAIKNLREATRSQNQGNQRKRRGTNAPLKGANWNRFRNYWQSYITVEGKTFFLGRFKSPGEAHAAYMAAATRLRGEFARAA